MMGDKNQMAKLMKNMPGGMPKMQNEVRFKNYDWLLNFVNLKS